MPKDLSKAPRQLRKLTEAIVQAIEGYNAKRPLFRISYDLDLIQNIADFKYNTMVFEEGWCNNEILQYYRIGENIFFLCWSGYSEKRIRKETGLTRAEYQACNFIYSTFEDHSEAIQYLRNVTRRDFQLLTNSDRSYVQFQLPSFQEEARADFLEKGDNVAIESKPDEMTEEISVWFSPEYLNRFTRI